MQIYIARDGVEIGEYSPARVEELARAGELLPNDHYWQEGMPDWLLLKNLLAPEIWEPLPSSAALPFYRHRFARPIGLVAGALLVILLLALLARHRSHSSNGQNIAPSDRPLNPPATETEVRDHAAADLRLRIDRLPARAEPPLNTYYYDVRVDMQKSLANRTPWMAIVRGSENVVDPATEQTIRRTQFTLTVDYHAGVWTYRRYAAVVSDLATLATTQIEDDEDAPTPPSIVGVLGLQRARR